MSARIFPVYTIDLSEASGTNFFKVVKIFIFVIFLMCFLEIASSIQLIHSFVFSVTLNSVLDIVISEKKVLVLTGKGSFIKQDHHQIIMQ